MAAEPLGHAIVPILMLAHHLGATPAALDTFASGGFAAAAPPSLAADARRYAAAADFADLAGAANSSWVQLFVMNKRVPDAASTLGTTSLFGVVTGLKDSKMDKALGVLASISDVRPLVEASGEMGSLRPREPVPPDVLRAVEDLWSGVVAPHFTVGPDEVALIVPVLADAVAACFPEVRQRAAALAVFAAVLGRLANPHPRPVLGRTVAVALVA